MAARTKAPASDVPATDEAPAPAPTEEAPTTLWEYTGEDQRTYVDGPVTVMQGDVVLWENGEPGDGRWTAAKPDAVAKRMDNEPEPEPEPEADAPADVEQNTTEG